MGVTVGVGVGGAVGVRLGKSEGAAVGTGVPGTAAGQPLLALLGMVHGCGCGIIHGTTCAAVVAHPAVAIIASSAQSIDRLRGAASHTLHRRSRFAGKRYTPCGISSRWRQQKPWARQEQQMLASV